MKRTIATAASIALLITSGAFADTRAGRRQDRQQTRIHQGVKDGQLTANEAAELEKKEARLRAEKRAMRKSGGTLTPRERARLDRQQSRLSKDIAHQKHDRQHRR